MDCRAQSTNRLTGIREMASSRNLKPGFFKNENLAECSPLARLLFAGLWCIADRSGRLEDRPKRIRAEVLPYDNGSVDDLLNELYQAGFIQRYRIGEQRFIQVQNFAKHQNPHCREPESTIPEPGKHSASTGQVSDEHRTGPADSLNPLTDSLSLIPEENHCSPSASESAHDGFATFWGLYPKKVAKPQAMKAWKKVKPTGQVFANLMAALEKQRASADWLKDGGQFIPHPATWLNGRRWEDEDPHAADKSAAPARNLVFEGAL